jgi:NitT/TauT family transport system substrate-binding protein
VTRIFISVLSFVLLGDALAQTPPLIRLGRGFAAEEQVWLMSARPDLAPNQGKRYQLKQILFQANPERFQAFLAGELDAGTAPGLAVIFARAQGMDMKIVASVCLEAAGQQYFSTTYMVKDDGPVKSVKDLKGGTMAVVGIKTATDLWARAGLINAGLVPDKDTKVVPMAFPVIGDAVRTGKVSAGTFVEPFYSAEVAKGGLRKLFTAVDAVGYDHELLDIFFGEKFLKANPDAVRAFLADYVAVTKYYLANMEQAKRDLHKAGFVRTPIEIYLKNADWKRDANARVDVESLKKLSTFMHEKLQWLDKPVNVDSMVDQSFLPR